MERASASKKIAFLSCRVSGSRPGSITGAFLFYPQSFLHKCSTIAPTL